MHEREGKHSRYLLHVPISLHEKLANWDEVEICDRRHSWKDQTESSRDWITERNLTVQTSDATP